MKEIYIYTEIENGLLRDVASFPNAKDCEKYLNEQYEFAVKYYKETDGYTLLENHDWCTLRVIKAYKHTTGTLLEIDFNLSRTTLQETAI